MTISALLTAATALASLAVVPAFATVDPPKASDLDRRMRIVAYDPNNPVLLPASPGVSLRLILGGDEFVERVIVSDQTIISPDPVEDEAPRSAVVTAIDGVNTVLTSKPAPAGQQRKAPVCDPNLCVDIAGNFIYLKPKRSLSRQPMFVQTSRVDLSTGQKIMVPYTFELEAVDPVDPPKPGMADPSVRTGEPAEAMWSVTFTYAAREQAERLAAGRKAAALRFEAERERAAMLPPPQPGPAASDNHRYGYKGSVAVKPDDGWDDGRTTFLRFNGNRRVPNVYERGPDGKPTLARWATEPDAAGITLRVAGTGTVWTLRDGDEAGCVINGGHDPEGRTAPTVSPLASAGR